VVFCPPAAKFGRRACLALSFTSESPWWSITPFHISVSCPTCALKSPKRIVDSLSLILCSTFLSSSTISGCYTFAFGPYICINAGSGLTIFPQHAHPFHRVIHSSTQHASWRLTSTPTLHGQTLPANAGVEKFPPIVQLNSVRTTTLSARDTNNIKGLPFGFLDQFVLFSCEWSDVPVSSH